MRHPLRSIRIACLTALFFPLFFGNWVPVLAQDEVVALRGGRLITVTDGIIDNGVLVMEGGLIRSIGAHVQIPTGARVIDVTGKTILPGLIDGYTNLGTADYPSYGQDDDEATDPITPQLRIIDALNPDNRFISMARSAGITTALCAPAEGNLITGQSALVHLAGSTMNEMVVRSPVAIHISLGEAPKIRYGGRNQMPATRMGSAALLRQTLVDAQGYADELDRYERKLAEYLAGEGEEGAEAPKPPARNLKQEALLPVLKGEMPVIVSADRFDDIHTALRIGEEFDLRLILNHGAEAHRLAKELSELEIPVLWGPSGARYRELESQEGTPETPAQLVESGILFAFQTGGSENVASLLEEARLAMSHGLSYQDALEALTIHPAMIFGVADQLGSLEAGKSADLVVFGGDPLQGLARVEKVFVKGKEW